MRRCAYVCTCVIICMYVNECVRRTLCVYVSLYVNRCMCAGVCAYKYVRVCMYACVSARVHVVCVACLTGVCGLPLVSFNYNCSPIRFDSAVYPFTILHDRCTSDIRLPW